MVIPCHVTSDLQTCLQPSPPFTHHLARRQQRTRLIFHNFSYKTCTLFLKMIDPWGTWANIRNYLAKKRIIVFCCTLSAWGWSILVCDITAPAYHNDLLCGPMLVSICSQIVIIGPAQGGPGTSTNDHCHKSIAALLHIKLMLYLGVLVLVVSTLCTRKYIRLLDPPSVYLLAIYV